MNMPGFTAEAALSRRDTTYRAAAGAASDRGHLVQPQLPPELACYFRCGAATGWWDLCAYACTRNPSNF